MTDTAAKQSNQVVVGESDTVVVRASYSILVHKV